MLPTDRNFVVKLRSEIVKLRNPHDPIGEVTYKLKIPKKFGKFFLRKISRDVRKSAFRGISDRRKRPRLSKFWEKNWKNFLEKFLQNVRYWTVFGSEFFWKNFLEKFLREATYLEFCGEVRKSAKECVFFCENFLGNFSVRVNVSESLSRYI